MHILFFIVNSVCTKGSRFLTFWRWKWRRKFRIRKLELDRFFQEELTKFKNKIPNRLSNSSLNNYIAYGMREAHLEYVNAWWCSVLLMRKVSTHFRATKGFSLFWVIFSSFQRNYLGNYCSNRFGILFINFVNSSWKNLSVQFFRLEIFLVTFTATRLRKTILIRPPFTIKNNMLNDFISFALSAHWHGISNCA